MVPKAARRCALVQRIPEGLTRTRPHNSLQVLRGTASRSPDYVVARERRVSGMRSTKTSATAATAAPKAKAHSNP